MAKKNDSYEKMMERLEEIVQKMENSPLSLEETIQLYEEGVSLSNRLYKLLNDAEGKIKILTSEGEKNFTVNEE